ncbi:MAG: MoxR family ATPase [Peptococcaceae bacterium]|jgi:MoxR-like ATPase|nr:MoxR family ATPase [Peptococcaceae bacterium]MDH7525628.1 MoxR family ATPase [Peptococcaceae bacterium]
MKEENKEVRRKKEDLQMDAGKAGDMCQKIIEKALEYFVADDDAILRKVLCGFIANGHILFEDNPGLGKTLLVKILAKATGCNWNRIQFTPDLMPSDIVGTKIWKAEKSTFELEKGPIFTNFLLADEINRAMPKTQSALLEAMEERQVTIEGTTHRLTAPFVVMATQNPIENEGTYPLPEAQLDRFLMKLSMGYMKTLAAECRILKRRISWQKDDPTGDIQQVVRQEDIVSLQQEAEKVYVDDNLLKYIGEIVRGTRENQRIRVGSSPRGGLALLKLSRACALSGGRDFVIPDDVKMFAADALSHRIILNIEHTLEGLDPAAVINEIVSNTEVPKDFLPR